MTITIDQVLDEMIETHVEPVIRHEMRMRMERLKHTTTFAEAQKIMDEPAVASAIQTLGTAIKASIKAVVVDTIGI